MTPSYPLALPRRPVGAVLSLAMALTGCAVQQSAGAAVPLGTPVERDVEERAALARSGAAVHAPFGLPVTRNLSVEDELNFLVGERPEVLSAWMDRGLPYRPFIEQVLDEWDLPPELYYLAMIESGFSPTARSHAGAVGMWQFMTRTGRSEGLRIDDWVDERRDPVRSTRAAARHLARLHDAFGDWPLALAAYNAGAGRISRGMERFGARDYWDLARRGDLARETQRYVPRIYAVAMVSRDPGAFGLERPTGSGWTFAFDSLVVTDSIRIVRLAEITGVRTDTLRALNPNLLRDATPPGRYTVWLPAGAAEMVARRYAGALPSRPRQPGRIAAAAADRARPGPARGDSIDMPDPSRSAGPEADSGPAEREHIVGEGEHLWTIARQYGIPISALEVANALGGRPVRAGERLVIPPLAASGAETGARVRESLPGEAVRSHRVQPGETLWGISRSYGVGLEALRDENGLAEDQTIRAGQELRIPAPALPASEGG